VRPMPSPSSGTPISCFRDEVPEVRPHHRVDTKDPVIESFGSPAGGRRLLIVDDDEEMLTLLTRMVACLGYGACTAASGKEALLRLQKGDVDLVITDYQMPLMDGFQLAFEIRRQYPSLPLILMTGYYGHDLEEGIKSRDLFAGLLKKPFNLKALGEKLTRIGASPGESRTG
jgi:CheY-like chemotaxis protein